MIIELSRFGSDELPEEIAVAAITMAELAAGPHSASDPAERARRQERVQYIDVAFNPLPFDANAARAYGRIAAAVLARGRKARGRRVVDLLIAATALSNHLPLYTRNPSDFADLGDLIEVVALAAR